MNSDKAVVLLLTYLRWKRRKQKGDRQYRVQPILQDRMTERVFVLKKTTTIFSQFLRFKFRLE